MENSERLPLIELDQLSEKIKEREHEETHKKIDELFRRINRREKVPANGVHLPLGSQKSA